MECKKFESFARPVGPILRRRHGPVLSNKNATSSRKKAKKVVVDELDMDCFPFGRRFKCPLQLGILSVKPIECMVYQTPIADPEVDHSLPYLPPQSSEHIGRKTLVLDLDQTLMDGTCEFTSTADFILVTLGCPNYFVKKRPFLEFFLTEVEKMFEVVVFTAAKKSYADKIIDKIDVDSVIKHRLYRKHCLPEGEEPYMKHLEKMGRKLEQIVIVDDRKAICDYQKNNSLNIPKFNLVNQGDSELLKILRKLEEINECDSVYDYFANERNATAEASLPEMDDA